MARKKASSVSIDSLRHQDRRANIPTEELRDFVAEEERSPSTMLYPRDPSLDPQLVWRGKDEQDRAGLTVPVVPVYIQEKIHPQALVENLLASHGKGIAEDSPAYGAEQLSFAEMLFDDFNGLPEEFDQRVEFYQHEGNWSNRMILGDSLLVMTSLAEKEGLKGKVQCIYIDPPYGIKFGSNWQVSTRKRDVRDGRAEDATRQPEQVRAFRDTWRLGIHSYLAYLRDRLVVARELLTETGSIFVQIGDENVHLVRCLMDEVFGSDNFVSLITFRKKTMPFGTNFAEQMGDFIVWYAKQKHTSDGRAFARYRPLKKSANVEGEFHHCWYELPDGSRHRMTTTEINNHALLPSDARVYRLKSLEPSGPMASGKFDYEFAGRIFSPPSNGYGTTPAGMDRLKQMRRLQPEGNRLTFVMYADENPAAALTVPWFDTVGADDKQYVVQTNTEVVKRCILMTTDPGDLVLDPTCGSGTTAYVAEQWGRRWITIDTSRVALALARTRLMAARYPYYHLADDYPEITQKNSDEEIKAHLRRAAKPANQTQGDVRKGFVYRRVPHVTLKSIANNAEIDVIHGRWQETLEPVREKLNRLLGQAWEEWQVPREPEASWSKEAQELLARWWTLRQQRQQEIDAAIARQADSEILYDQPYEDRKRVRVTGPMTVESLSPHRTLSTDDADGSDESPKGETPGWSTGAADDFALMIIDNLRVAGVQNTVKGERLTFDRLDPYPGRWLHAAGEYSEHPSAPGDAAQASVRRVAVSIGPEHGTVGPDQVKEAAKEAVQGIGFDLLIVCGFAFDPHVSEEARRYGTLTVLPARMNPDLAMGDELLKKTGAGNLFMIFGEPDVEIHQDAGGELTVEIKGVDVYDPTTGEIRASSSDDIACWFIDTSYDGESFFVRHAYFTGADEPYDKLKRALRSEIDEAAWSALYSTVSRPFGRPETGRIAVKVINHYGDEVLKVFEV